MPPAPPQKLQTLLLDHQLHQNGVAFHQRPLSQGKKLFLLPILAASFATELAARPILPPSLQPLPRTEHSAGETQKFLLEQTQAELRPSHKKFTEEAQYAARLEGYKKNPPRLEEILTDVWEDLGLSREKAKSFVQNSFQNKNHIPTDLNKRATLLYAEEDILQAGTLTGLKNFFKCGVHAGILATTTKLLNTQHQENIPAPPTENPTPEELEKTWQHIEALTQRKPEALATLDLVKNLADEMVEKMLDKAAGWAAPRDHVYIVSKKYDAKTIFQFIAAHEATHTGQSLQIPPHLTHALNSLKEGLVSAFCEKIDQKQAIAQHAGMAIHPNEARAKKESFAEEISYLTEPKEIATWTGMIKKIYFEQTGKLLEKTSTEDDLTKFHEWLRKPNSEKNEYKSHVIQTFRVMNKILGASPETKKILSEHLLDVAQKKPTLKKEKENPNAFGIC